MTMLFLSDFCEQSIRLRSTFGRLIHQALGPMGRFALRRTSS